MREVEPQELPTGWINTDIGRFAPLQRGFDLPNRERIDGKYPVVYSNGVMNYHHKYQVKGPGVVTGRSGTIGKVHYVEKDYWPHNTALWVKEFNNAFPNFVYYLYSYIGFERFSSGSGVPTLNRNDAHSFAINVPENKKEQTAIANALSDVDALLTELEKLIAKKQAIKTATMQQLLTGKTRLPQFATYTEGEKKSLPKGTKPSELGEIPEDWDVIEFGNCIRTVVDNRGKTPPLTNDGLPMLEVNAVFKQGRSPNLEKVTKYVSQHTYDNWFRDGHPKHGDILVVTVGSAGETSYVDKEGYCIAQNLISLRLNQSIDNAFAYYITTFTPFKKQVEAVLMGAVQPSLKVPHLKKFKTLIPVAKEEQTAIATILSDMDNEIQTLEQRLVKTRQIKQGMMQELLTGRTRLPFDKV